MLRSLNYLNVNRGSAEGFDHQVNRHHHVQPDSHKVSEDQRIVDRAVAIEIEKTRLHHFGRSFSVTWWRQVVSQTTVAILFKREYLVCGGDDPAEDRQQRNQSDGEEENREKPAFPVQSFLQAL